MPKEDSSNRIVDAHIHVWTDDFDRYPLAPGVKKEDLWLPSFTIEEFLAYARLVGDVRINLVQMIWYVSDHSYILDLIAGDPETFAGTGVINLDDPEPDGRMLELASQGCHAFREPPSKLDHPAMDKLFVTGAENQLALSFNMGVDLLPAMDRMCARHPQTPVILDHVCHVGIGIPDYSQEDLEALQRFARHENVMIKIGPLQGLCGRRAPYLDFLPLLQGVVEAYGAHRCMWESDSGGPIRMENPVTDYPAAVALIRDHATFLSGSEKEDILFGTAERFFFTR